MKLDKVPNQNPLSVLDNFTNRPLGLIEKPRLVFIRWDDICHVVKKHDIVGLSLYFGCATEVIEMLHIGVNSHSDNSLSGERFRPSLGLSFRMAS